ncbi:MAG: trigger factor [Chitinivibrionales bacterium]|nr:trigger factor [Chitinivibrionales bacterium]
MKATVTEKQSWQKILHIEIPDDEYQKEYQEKLKKVKRDIKLPGFRPGKVPTNLITTRFGSSIRMEVIDDLINRSYREACKENKIMPLTEAKITDLATSENQPISFKAEIEIDPDIVIEGYKDVSVPVVDRLIEPHEVDEIITDLQNRLAQFNEVDGPSSKGDMISFEYVKVIIDGQESSALQAPRYPVEIGKSSVIKELDDNLIGLITGQEKVITITFPDDYYQTEIAGKTAQVTIKVTKIEEKIIAEINEEFLKKVGDYTSVEQLREKIKIDLEKRARSEAETAAQNKAIDLLIENNSFEIPPSRVQFYIDQVMKEEERYYGKNKMPPRQEFEDRYTEIAIRSLKRYRILQYIAKVENVKATQDEVDKRIEAIAEHYNRPFEEVKNKLRKEGTTLQIREEIKEQKVLDCLIGKQPWGAKEEKE